MFDFLIIGAGLFGATFARQLTDAGQRCLLIEKRPHIAGNCFTTQTAGITVHQYGPHFFHTNSRHRQILSLRGSLRYYTNHSGM